MTHTSIPAGAHIGHVHLKVANLDRAIGFYRDLLGFDLLMNFGTAALATAFTIFAPSLAMPPCS